MSKLQNNKVCASAGRKAKDIIEKTQIKKNYTPVEILIVQLKLFLKAILTHFKCTLVIQRNDQPAV